MDYTHDDDSATIVYDDAARELTVVIKDCNFPKRLIYGDVTEGMFRDLVNLLEEDAEYGEGLNAVLDRWEH